MAGGEPRALGVGDDGALPLPWLVEPLRRVQCFDAAHALLLHAGADVGQFDLALAASQGWLCERTPAPCGRCASCRQVRARTHPDHRVVVPDALRLAFGWLVEDDPLLKASAKPSRDIRVEQVREAIEWSQRSAGTARGRALVVHPADALNAAAANALLKTLEEPPGRLRIVLVGTDPDRLLPTVRSRLQRYRVPAPETVQAAGWLAARGVDDAALPLQVVAGSPLDAFSLVEQGFDTAALAALPGAVARGDASPLAGTPIPRVLDLLLKIAHDAMALTAGAEPQYFRAPHLPTAAASLSELQRWRASLLRVARHDEHPWHAPLLVEALVTDGARCWAGAPPRRAAPRGPSLHSSR